MGGGAYSSSVVTNSVTGERELKYDDSIRKGKLLKSKGISDIDSMSRGAIFKQKNINNKMNPHGIKVRESRDSAEHQNSIAIVFGLDVTGSMMGIPHYLVQQGLPKIMGKIIQKGVADPQVLFLGIGDHECDSAPLQVGQFESDDELLDGWLMDVFLEGGGGGNAGESYLLAWYFAGYHTSIDCFEKRGEKGFLFTIGDEPDLPMLPAENVKRIMGPGQYVDYTNHDLLAKAQEKYDVYHIHMTHGRGSRKETIDDWKQLLGDHLIEVENQEETATVIADIITSRPGVLKNVSAADVINISAIDSPMSIADKMNI